jgi:DNA-binding NarL/FixJ family response regulator
MEPKKRLFLLEDHRLFREGLKAMLPPIPDYEIIGGESYPNKEIAGLVNIRVKTVEKHRADIMAKLDLHNAAALTAFACAHGLIFAKS